MWGPSGRVLCQRADDFEDNQEIEMYQKGLITKEVLLRNRETRRNSGKIKIMPVLKRLAGWLIK